ncbi:hypothetical protein HPP92_007613 [Vanilla planifolia]|uniref:Uncharacterized protein n=1 Tax=Vanilla planifolia TaxID=51239 RepID=A0A835RMQ9_VANPL|nr:hypothetical protein HPP92_007613 [Vanilla planifolia]
MSAIVRKQGARRFGYCERDPLVLYGRVLHAFGRWLDCPLNFRLENLLGQKRKDVRVSYALEQVDEKPDAIMARDV